MNDRSDPDVTRTIDRRVRTRPATVPDMPAPTSHGPTSHGPTSHGIAGRLRTRARRLRIASWVCAGFLVAMLVLGGFVLSHAQGIAIADLNVGAAFMARQHAALDAEMAASLQDKDSLESIRHRIAVFAGTHATPIRPRVRVIDADTTIIGVHFAGQTHGWAVGRDGTILATTDGGDTWRQLNAGTEEFLFSVRFVDKTHGWAAGDNGMILATTDGGVSWQGQTSGVSKALTAVHFADSLHGWAVGGAGTILTTADGGLTWRAQASGVTASLANVHFIDQKHGWAVGLRGTILVTADGGATWRKQDSGVATSLASVHFLDPKHGWAVGLNGTLLCTTDGGLTWTKRETALSHAFTDVHFADPGRGWVVGQAGTVLSTTDAGATWRRMESGTTNDLYGVHFSLNRQAWAVGGGGTLLAIATPDVSAVVAAQTTAALLTALRAIGIAEAMVAPMLAEFRAAETALSERTARIERDRQALATQAGTDTAAAGGLFNSPMFLVTLYRGFVAMVVLCGAGLTALLYRHALRLSEHHDACADALLLTEAGSGAGLPELVRALSPLHGTGIHRLGWLPPRRWARRWG